MVNIFLCTIVLVALRSSANPLPGTFRLPPAPNVPRHYPTTSSGDLSRSIHKRNAEVRPQASVYSVPDYSSSAVTSTSKVSATTNTPEVTGIVPLERTVVYLTQPAVTLVDPSGNAFATFGAYTLAKTTYVEITELATSSTSSSAAPTITTTAPPILTDTSAADSPSPYPSSPPSQSSSAPPLHTSTMSPFSSYFTSSSYRTPSTSLIPSPSTPSYSYMVSFSTTSLQPLHYASLSALAYPTNLSSGPSSTPVHTTISQTPSTSSPSPSSPPSPTKELPPPVSEPVEDETFTYDPFSSSLIPHSKTFTLLTPSHYGTLPTGSPSNPTTSWPTTGFTSSMQTRPEPEFTYNPLSSISSASAPSHVRPAEVLTVIQTSAHSMLVIATRTPAILTVKETIIQSVTVRATTTGC